MSAVSSKPSGVFLRLTLTNATMRSKRVNVEMHFGLDFIINKPQRGAKISA